MRSRQEAIVFVSMPSSTLSNEIYRLAIKPACKSIGATSERWDELRFGGQILQEVYTRISKADGVIADVSTASPNVWFELGVANALGKKTVLIANEATQLPFDLANFRVVFFVGDIPKLKKELTGMLKSVLVSRRRILTRRKVTKLSVKQPLTAIVFGDLVSSTLMMRHLGELDFQEFLKSYFAHAADLARNHKGSFVKAMGDSFLATFETVQDAVDFAQAFRRTSTDKIGATTAQLKTRLAIHFARIALRMSTYGEDITGSDVVFVVRLAEVALPGEIVLSERATKELRVTKSVQKKYLKQPLKLKKTRLKGFPNVVKFTALLEEQGEGDA